MLKTLVFMQYFRFLAPIEDENEGFEPKCNLPETRAIDLLSKSSKHQHLLKHPIFRSFLWLKWDRIHKIYNTNVRFYTLFVFILTWFIFEKFGSKAITNENNSLYQYLFYVTCCLVFITLMLYLIKDLCNAIYMHDGLGIFYRCIEGFLLIACISFILIVEILDNKNGKLWDRRLDELVFAFTIIVTIREVCQMMVNITGYFFNKENWIEILFVGMIYYIIFNLWTEMGEYNPLSRILSSIVLVLSWTELIILVFRHPNLTR